MCYRRWTARRRNTSEDRELRCRSGAIRDIRRVSSLYSCRPNSSSDSHKPLPSSTNHRLVPSPKHTLPKHSPSLLNHPPHREHLGRCRHTSPREVTTMGKITMRMVLSQLLDLLGSHQALQTLLTEHPYQSSRLSPPVPFTHSLKLRKWLETRSSSVKRAQSRGKNGAGRCLIRMRKGRWSWLSHKRRRRRIGERLGL